MTIKIPEVSPKRQLARKLFDAVISQVPLVGGPYTAMLSVTHPSKLELLHAEWQKDVTGAINDMEKIIDQLLPEITLSDLASSIGLWISQNSERGMTDSIRFSKIEEAFPNATKLEIQDACGELELVGLATLSGAIGHNIINVRPTNSLFEIFDPSVFEDVNPRLDAAHLARFILANHDTVSAEEVMQHFGWNVRRYNPAMGIVSAMVGDGRKGKEINPTYNCRYVMPDSKERAALRHFTNEVLGNSK